MLQLVKTEMTDYTQANVPTIEQSILGILLAFPAERHRVIDRLVIAAFYEEAHRIIYKAIKDIHAKGATPDLTFVADRLQAIGELSQIGGREYLWDLAYNCSTTWQLEAYADKLMSAYLARKQRAIFSEMLNLSQETNDPVELYDTAQTKLKDIGQQLNTRHVRTIGELTDAVLDRFKLLEELRKTGKTYGVQTGFADLDQKLLGLEPGTLTLLGARPGIGKSLFAGCCAQNIAVSQDLPVAFFSIEMTSEEITARLTVRQASKLHSAAKRGSFNTQDWIDYEEAKVTLAESPLHIFDKTDGIDSIEKIHAHIKRLQFRKTDPALIIIDQLTHISKPKELKELQQHEWYEQTARDLKHLAVELNKPILLLHQLNRALEHRGDKRPGLADLKGAGEAEADVVLLLHREIDKDKEKTGPQICEVIIAKNRGGETGIAKLTYDGGRVSFFDADSPLIPQRPEKKEEPKMEDESMIDLMAGASPPEPVERIVLEDGTVAYKQGDKKLLRVWSYEQCESRIRKANSENRLKELFDDMSAWLGSEVQIDELHQQWAGECFNRMDEVYDRLFPGDANGEPVFTQEETAGMVNLFEGD